MLGTILESARHSRQEREALSSMNRSNLRRGVRCGRGAKVALVGSTIKVLQLSIPACDTGDMFSGPQQDVHAAVPDLQVTDRVKLSKPIGIVAGLL